MKRSKQDPLKTLKTTLQTVILIGVMLILAVFPLVYGDYYFDILSVKYRFFYSVVLGMAALLTAIIGVYGIYDVFSGEGKQIHAFFDEGKGLFGRLHPANPYLALGAFLLCATLSTVFSPYRFEAFWGNEGRYTGLFLLLVYGIGYFIVSRFFRYKNWIVDLCLAAGTLVCLFGITDYFQMDILKFKALMVPEQRQIFTSTIGNINTYTSYVSLFMGLSATLFCAEKKIGPRMIAYYCLMVISFFAQIMGQSDNVYLALAALFAILPLYLFGTWGGVRRYLLVVATFLAVVCAIARINVVYAGVVLELTGLFPTLAKLRMLPYLTGLAWLAWAIWAVAAHYKGFLSWLRAKDAGKAQGKAGSGQAPGRPGIAGDAVRRGGAVIAAHAGRQGAKTSGSAPTGNTTSAAGSSGSGRKSSKKHGKAGGQAITQASAANQIRHTGGLTETVKGASTLVAQADPPSADEGAVAAKPAPALPGNVLRIAWLALLGVAVAAVVFIALDANLWGHASRYGAMSEYLVFDDEWGTHRMYIWKLGLRDYGRFNWFQKLFGYGPDTFGILSTTITSEFREMTRRYGEYFDSLHNEYLQYFVTIGPLGLLSYLWLLITSWLQMGKHYKENPYLAAILVALVCYGLQATVNINLPIATPVMWALMMVGVAGARCEAAADMETAKTAPAAQNQTKNPNQRK
ncbi:MAG: O-antigen ligase family protein [Lachnospiraceae bacterium]|jgi:hypothetical protein|nr:O-antigen ligase family protein [Lachnospiraceae bacterium]